MDEERQAKFLELLWQEQRQLGLNDYRLAKLLEVNQSTVHRLHKGIAGVGVEVMFKAARAFPSIRIFLASELLMSKADDAPEHDPINKHEAVA